MIYVGDNKFYVSEEENKTSISCSKIEVHLEDIECANPKEEKVKPITLKFSLRRLKRQIKQGKLIMYEDDKEYILKNRKGKVIDRFNKTEVNG